MTRNLEKLACVTATAVLLGAAVPAGAAETQRAAAGPQYDRGSLHTFWFGKGYRDLWVTPLELEVLDLEEEAGGLTPVRQVGGMQTPGLAFTGADGRSYTFRSIDKDPGRLLPEKLQKGVMAFLVRDQTAASHPGVSEVLDPVVTAVGGLHWPEQKMVVMPDDPTLGEHRELFAGMVGTFYEFPMPAGDDNPGFKGASEIVSSRKLWDRWLEGPQNGVDARSFLRHRVVDLWMGNWDRHRKQWRWARVPGESGYQPIAEDPDQIFSDYQGVMLSVARVVSPKLVRFQDRISGMEAMAENGADLDRWLLTGLGREAFMETARDVRARLTDDVIDDAVGHLPPEWHALNGKALAARLKRRRDDLERAVEEYYLHLAGAVNVHGSDLDEEARIERLSSGELEVTVAVAGSEPHYRRRFSPAETSEVRIYLHGGKDRATSHGRPDDGVKVRVIGGPGDDCLDDRAGGGTEFFDFEGDNRVVEGPGTRVFSNDWANPSPETDAPWLEPRDFKARTKPSGVLNWTPDLGVLAGLGLNRTAWAFRAYPYRTRQSLSFAWSSTRNRSRLAYGGTFRRMGSSLFADIQARVSGLDRLNYYGLGNETDDDGGQEQFRVAQTAYVLRPTLDWGDRKGLEVGAGIELHYSDEGSEGTVVAAERPYGSGAFGQVGLVADLKWDTRDLEGRPTEDGMARAADVQGELKDNTAVTLEAEGKWVPGAWDVEDGFGAVEAEITGHLGLGKSQRVVLAGRAGGRRLWGTFPWYEAAFVGGPDSNRGLRSERFAGRSSLYGNAELRLQLYEGTALIPGRFWIFGLADASRVWVDGEESGDWHPSFGGGLAVELAGAPLAFWVGAARTRGSDDSLLYFRSGVGF
jgi:hypothetical protein